MTEFENQTELLQSDERAVALANCYAQLMELKPTPDLTASVALNCSDEVAFTHCQAGNAKSRPALYNSDDGHLDHHRRSRSTHRLQPRIRSRLDSKKKDQGKEIRARLAG
jgi:hypothetical protein